MGAEQKGYAAGNRTARFLAIGAPKSEDHAVIREPCDTCGETTEREFGTETSGEGRTVILYCSDCGTECERFGAGPE